MMTPRESFDEIARLLAVATEALDCMAHSEHALEALGCIVAAQTHAMNQAALLHRREKAGELFALPCITETLQ